MAQTLFTTSATATAGRAGTITTPDGVLNLTTAMPGSGKTGATNPEQLFAAGYAACFGSALLAVAGPGKLPPDSVHITGDVSLLADGHDYSIAVKLTVKIDGIPHEEAEKLAHTAHQVCPYSKATRGNIPVELTVV